MDFINQQIEYFTKIKNEYNDEFSYLQKENIKTCDDNQENYV